MRFTELLVAVEEIVKLVVHAVCVVVDELEAGHLSEHLAVLLFGLGEQLRYLSFRVHCKQASNSILYEIILEERDPIRKYLTLAHRYNLAIKFTTFPPLV